MKYYPLRFKEILRNYGFGDRWIPKVFDRKALPDDQRIAETWEVCDRPNESSQIINGTLAGQTLHEVIEADPLSTLGWEVLNQFGTWFPLLIKILDVTNPLGEQVHPTDELAARRKLNDPGKTEAWYILHTRPGGMVYCGQRDDSVNPTLLRQALENGNIKDLMRPYIVQPGDSFLLYAGTMHYSPGGVLFYEIMQNSDVYVGLKLSSAERSAEDHDKQTSEILEAIHLEKGFECHTKPIKLGSSSHQRSFILACQHFALERLDLRESYRMSIDGRHFHVLTVIEGICDLTSTEWKERLYPGHTCFLPASLKSFTLQPQRACVILNAYVPNLLFDIVQPLKQNHIPDEEIIQLGGNTILNPLRSLV